jgi:hypothetical protein
MLALGLREPCGLVSIQFMLCGSQFSTVAGHTSEVSAAYNCGSATVEHRRRADYGDLTTVPGRDFSIRHLVCYISSSDEHREAY